MNGPQLYAMARLQGLGVMDAASAAGYASHPSPRARNMYKMVCAIMRECQGMTVEEMMDAGRNLEAIQVVSTYTRREQC